MNYIWFIIATFNWVSGQNGFATNRIVGGYEVNPHFKYSFMTSLQRDGKHFCGGTLINANTVISAAHCELLSRDILTEAVFHRHNVKKSDRAEHGIRRRVAYIIKHPGYNNVTVVNDISIWKLEKKVAVRPNIYLDNNRKPMSKGRGSVIGWGAIKEEGIRSPKLLEVRVPFVPVDKCQEMYRNSQGKVQKNTNFCAGFVKGGRDACNGDSGGPFFIQRNGNAVLMGIVSWGEGCAQPNNPGVYTKVAAYIGWINKYLDL